MLKTEAAFPYVGSYALLEARDATHLVRIVHSYFAEGKWLTTVSLPLKDGATGNRTAPADELVDGTPLDAADRRRLADLNRELRGRRISSPRLKAMAAERDRLKQRAMFAPILADRLRQLHTPWQHRREQQRSLVA